MYQNINLKDVIIKFSVEVITLGIYCISLAIITGSVFVSGYMPRWAPVLDTSLIGFPLALHLLSICVFGLITFYKLRTAYQNPLYRELERIDSHLPAFLSVFAGLLVSSLMLMLTGQAIMAAVN